MIFKRNGILGDVIIWNIAWDFFGERAVEPSKVEKDEKFKNRK
jgi:hypothetical protein